MYINISSTRKLRIKATGHNSLTEIGRYPRWMITWAGVCSDNLSIGGIAGDESDWRMRLSG